ncbi:hypothetical protein D7322_13850 [Sphingobacterium puteale]|uniref:Uncharacterized protein n=1 Tax=Sphingobacterium puteale TaxID=2420510 RepID=A0A420VXW3_9SPHI|nr:hypothetical protein D7322_13850 [Sphingobacterium puteale]
MADYKPKKTNYILSLVKFSDIFHTEHIGNFFTMYFNCAFYNKFKHGMGCDHFQLFNFEDHLFGNVVIFYLENQYLVKFFAF